MLKINPNDRLTANQCLQSKIFDPVRQKVPTLKPIVQPFLTTSTYDYMTRQDTAYSINDFKRMLI